MAQHGTARHHSTALALTRWGASSSRHSSSLSRGCHAGGSWPAGWRQGGKQAARGCGRPVEIYIATASATRNRVQQRMPALAALAHHLAAAPAGPAAARALRACGSMRLRQTGSPAGAPKRRAGPARLATAAEGATQHCCCRLQPLQATAAGLQTAPAEPGPAAAAAGCRPAAACTANRTEAIINGTSCAAAWHTCMHVEPRQGRRMKLTCRPPTAGLTPPHCRAAALPRAAQPATAAAPLLPWQSPLQQL